jgi:hypothetical protein
MSDTLHLGWSQKEASSAGSHYRTAMAFYLAAYVVAGLTAILAPSVVRHALALTPPQGWIRAAGGLILLVAAFQLPAWQNAVRSRVTALIATMGRFLLAILWLTAGGPFIWIGLFEAVFAVLLGWLLFRYFSAELMSRP